MEGRLLIITRHCEKHKEPSNEGATATETLRGPWILEPENDPNSLGTHLTEDQIPKNPPSLLHSIADAQHRVAEPSVLEFLTWLLATDRFQATEEWKAWELLSMNFKKTRESGREWTESFEVVIVRHYRRGKGMHRIEQWKNQVVMGDAD